MGGCKGGHTTHRNRGHRGKVRPQVRPRINRASRSEVWADRAKGGRESWGRALGTDRALVLESRVFVAVKPWAGDRTSLMPRGFALSSNTTVLTARPV